MNRSKSIIWQKKVARYLKNAALIPIGSVLPSYNAYSSFHIEIASLSTLRFYFIDLNFKATLVMHLLQKSNQRHVFQTAIVSLRFRNIKNLWRFRRPAQNE